MDGSDRYRALLIFNRPPEGSQFADLLRKTDAFDVDVAEDSGHGMSLVTNQRYDALVVDQIVGSVPGVKLLGEILGRGYNGAVIFVADRMDREAAGEALRLGAWDYFVKTADNRPLIRILTKAIIHVRQVNRIATLEAQVADLERQVSSPSVALERFISLRFPGWQQGDLRTFTTVWQRRGLPVLFREDAPTAEIRAFVQTILETVTAGIGEVEALRRSASGR